MVRRIVFLAVLWLIPAAAVAHTVRVDRTTVRTGPGPTWPVVTTLEKGSVVATLLGSGSWIAINRPVNGWVEIAHLDDTPHPATEQWKWVSASTLNVRSGAGTSHPVIGKLAWGTPVTVVTTSADWSQLSGPVPGWVYAPYLALEPPVNSQTRFVTTSALNLRGGPATTFPATDTLAWDTQLTVANLTNGWAQITAPVSGYVYAAYLSVNQPSRRATRWVAVDVANIRSGPGTQYPIVGQLKKNDPVTAMKIAGGWAQLSNGYVAAWLLTAEPPRTTSFAIRYVAVTSIDVRSGPNPAYPIVDRLPWALRVEVTSIVGTWAKISEPVSGYVPAAGLSSMRPNPTGSHFVTIQELNVRSGPGVDFSILDRLGFGDRVKVLETKSGWARIGEPIGGWVSVSYLSTTNPDPGPGVTVPPEDNPYGLPVSTKGYLQLPERGIGFRCQSPFTRRWGTPRLVNGIIALGMRMAKHGRIIVGDISFKHGGQISGHNTHRKGVDADLALLRNDGKDSSIGGTYYWSSWYSRDLNQTLVREMHDIFDVDVIYLNDKGVYGTNWYPNHDDHHHLRIRK